MGALPAQYSGSRKYTRACFCFILLFISSTHVQMLARSETPSSSFQDAFVITWGFDHVTSSSDGDTLWLMLDNSSGSSMVSKKSYLFGSVSMQMKLVPGDSAGVVTAYYMASDHASTRDELDFEFLGNQSGEPYILQTNVYTRGHGGREQRIYLWFDPTQDFHAYSFSWTPDQILFAVDEVPIRVFYNNEKQGILYPHSQAMRIYSSIWNGDEWATQGGSIKIDWTQAPFLTSYTGFRADACDPATSQCQGLPASWGGQVSLTASQLRHLEEVKQKYMVYDYCTDASRYSTTPLECLYNP